MIYISAGTKKYKLNKKHITYQKQLPEDATCIQFSTLKDECSSDNENHIITIDDVNYRLLSNMELDGYSIMGYLTTDWPNLYVGILSDKELKAPIAPLIYSSVAIGACVLGCVIYNGCSDIYEKYDRSNIADDKNNVSVESVIQADYSNQVAKLTDINIAYSKDKPENSDKRVPKETQKSEISSEETTVKKEMAVDDGKDDKSDNNSVTIKDGKSNQIESDSSNTSNDISDDDEQPVISNATSKTIESSNEKKNSIQANDLVKESTEVGINTSTSDSNDTDDKLAVEKNGTVKDTVFYTDENYNDMLYAKGKVREENLIAAMDMLNKIPQYILDDFQKKGWIINIINEDIDYNGISASGITTYAVKTIDIKNNEGLVRSSIVHEMGHFFDCSLGFISESDGFINDIYPSEKDNFKYTYTTKSKHEISDVYEYFASTFDEYITNPDNLEQCCPRTYEFLKNIV